MTVPALVDPRARLVIGHRGAAGYAPENTLPSFDLALAHGADALELDVRLTRDGIPVVLHDSTLDRTTGAAGPIAARTLADLTTVDAGARFSASDRTCPFRGQGVRIPTLRTVLERYPKTPLLIELKVAEAAAAVAEELLRGNAAERTVVASFLDRAVAPFRDPPFNPGASRRDILVLAAASLTALPLAGARTRAYAVPDRYRGRIPVPTPRFVRAAHRRGAAVHVWTVDEPARAVELWTGGVSGIITNFPDRLVQALREVVSSSR